MNKYQVTNPDYMVDAPAVWSSNWFVGSTTSMV